MTIEEAKKLLEDAGYLFFKIPECEFKGTRHGRHTLKTRSAMCEGENPRHAFHSTYRGSFGWLNNCTCGRSFADYTYDKSTTVTPWDLHVLEHNIDESPKK